MTPLNSNILEKVKRTRRLISSDDYNQMMLAGIFKPEEKLELINGQLIQMSPIHSFHATTVRKNQQYLYKILGDDLEISIQNPIQIGEHSNPEPDVAILRFREDGYLHQHPLPPNIVLIIEVADTSLEYDRKVKVPLYATAGIKEYWIINVNGEKVEVFTGPKNRSYQKKSILRSGESFRSISLEAEIGIDEIIVSIR